VTQDVRSDPGGLVPGEQLAGYQIQEQIGRGGMAVVYRALDLRLGRLVALKVLAPQLGEDEAFRQRFIRESRAAAGVDHPHIIPVFDAGEAGGVLFIAMRYVGYGDVRSLIDAEGRLSPARTASITSQVASALDAAHAHGLVHRDVKPGNMLLAHAGGDSDHVYLSDFGLSKHSLTPSTLTSTGQFLGTLDYVSPEQIQGQPVDGRADQYALACTAVEMLTGAPPFRRDDSMALMWAQLEAAPPRLTERRPDLPPAIDQVVATAMAKSPASRFASCRDFALALSAACELATPRSAGPTPTAASRYPVQAAPQTRADAPAAGSRPADLRASAEPGWPDGSAARADDHVPGKIDGRQHAARDPAQSPASVRTPTDQARLANVRPAGLDDIFPGTRQVQPGRAAAARGRSGRHRARNVVLAIVIVAAGLAGITGIGYKLLHHQAAQGTPVGGSTVAVTGGQHSPVETVRAYFTAINQHRYGAAWKIGGLGEQFSTFEAGYAGTKHDSVTILSTVGNVVTARLVAKQTDGSVKTYEGTYTVTRGVITKADVQQTS
jgi:Protein kinase domain